MSVTTPNQASPASAPVVRDWSWSHGPIAGPVNAAAGVCAAGMVGDLAAVSPWWGAGVGVAAAAGMTARAKTRDISPEGLLYRATCWLGAGGWLTWALATSAWSPDVLAALAAGAIGAGLAAPEMADHETRFTARRIASDKTRADDALAAEQNAGRLAVAREWETRILRVTRIPGITIRGIQTWPGDIGYTLEAVLPPGGVTYQQVREYAQGLAADVPLPHGCSVEVEPGLDRGHALIKVGTVDTTAVALSYPADYSPLTLNDSLPIGMHGGGIEAAIDLLDTRMMATGQIGSGKTNLLHVVNADLVRCPDALLWHIDLNGSGMSTPWLRPWLDGRADRPVVDWVAPTVEEAVRMLRCAVRIAKGRKVAYKDLMIRVNDDKIPIGISLPGIEIVFDEGAEGVAANRGNQALAIGFESLLSTSRAARIGQVISGVRATADIMPAGLQAQTATKVTMRPSDAHEVAQLLGWGVQKMINEAAVPGEGLLKQPGSGIRRFTAYRLAPQQIAEIAITCAARRPTLDKPSQDFAGDDYANRWDRYRSWLQSQGEEAPMPPTPRIPADPSEPDEPRSKGEGIAGLGPAAAAMEASLVELRKVREEAEAANAARRASEGTSENTRDQFAAIIGDEQPSGQARMLEILAEAGSAGLHWETLQARLKNSGHDISKATLYRWLDDPAVGQIGSGVWGIKPPS